MLGSVWVSLVNESNSAPNGGINPAIQMTQMQVGTGGVAGPIQK
jgi:hypothetical protein